MNGLIDRLIGLGFSTEDANDIDAALEEGFPEDVLPLLTKPQYRRILRAFSLTSGVLYRAQLLDRRDITALRIGTQMQFDAPFKAWTTNKKVILPFLKPYGAFVTAVALRMPITPGVQVIDIGALTNMNRWKDNSEVWANFPGYTRSDVFKTVTKEAK